MTAAGNLLIIVLIVLIVLSIVTLSMIITTKSELREFKQETVAEIESIKDRLVDIEYRVHKLEHPAPVVEKIDGNQTDILE